MRIPGLKGLDQSARWLRSRFINGALILGYHRVAETARDTYAMRVTPQRFAEQLEVLRRYAYPISLPKLVTGLSNNNLPNRAVVLTTDDGYVDVLKQAKPLLERYEIPATVFVTTGYLGRVFWWDQLQETLYSPGSLPHRLSLTLNGHTSEWTVGPDADSEDRERLLLSLCDLLRPLPEEERQDGMAQIRSWAGAESGDWSRHRALTADELIELAEGGLIDVGAHTVTHPVLSLLSKAEQRAEIQESKAVLEQILGRSISSFSYPNGSMSTDTPTSVREAGFDCACGSCNDIIRSDNDPYNLPRFWIQNWDGVTFTCWLKRWL